MSVTDAGPAGYRMADIHIDPGTRQVRRGDTVLQLPGLSLTCCSPWRAGHRTWSAAASS